MGNGLDEFVGHNCNPRTPFAGRWFGLFNVEGDDGTPEALYPTEEDASRELARRQLLDPEDSGWLSDHYQVFPVDLAGTWWNSYNPDPRAVSPLSAKEIAAVVDE